MSADTEKLIADLRYALGGTTPGPWTIEIDGDDYILGSAANNYMMCDTAYYPTALEFKDACYVVAAQPDNIRALLDRIASLEAALRTSLVAMKLANALPGVSDEYDFGPAIDEATASLSSSKQKDGE